MEHAAVAPLAKRVRRASSWKLGSICSGIGVCHRAAAVVSKHNPSLDIDFVFACEHAPYARRVLAADFPGLPVFGDACEDAVLLPPCDILAAGFPCQPFSSSNRHRKGSKDSRCTVVMHILAYIQRVRPRIVIFENVPGIFAWGKDVIQLIVQTFERCHYRADIQVLKSHIHGGVPQKRHSVYIVGIWSPTHALIWPRAMPMQSLPSLMSDEVLQLPGSLPTATKAAAKIKVVETKLAEHGLSAEERSFMVVNCHSQLGKLFVGTTPCLTAARGAQGGFWLLGHNRMMSLDELLRLQGLDPSSTHMASTVSSRQAGMLIGNCFTLPVVGRVLISALRACGCPVEDSFLAK